MYGFVFIKTVSTFPSAMFYVGALSVAASFFSVLFVRLQRPEHHPDRHDVEDIPEGLTMTRDATFVDVRGDVGTSSKVNPSD